MSSIEIIPLAAEHREAIINLLVKSFFHQEPLNEKLEFDLPNEPMLWIEHSIEHSLKDECSFVAIDTATPERKLVGVILNVIVKRNENDDFVTSSEKLNFVFSLLEKVSADHDLWEKYQTDRLFDCHVINIDESQRGQNLSSRLILRSLKKAKELGVKGAMVICSSLFSRKAFIRHGFHVVKEILYDEFGNGRLHDMGVHDRCTLLAKQL